MLKYNIIFWGLVAFATSCQQPDDNNPTSTMNHVEQALSKSIWIWDKTEYYNADTLVATIDTSYNDPNLGHIFPYVFIDFQSSLYNGIVNPNVVGQQYVLLHNSGYYSQYNTASGAWNIYLWETPLNPNPLHRINGIKAPAPPQSGSLLTADSLYIATLGGGQLILQTWGNYSPTGCKIYYRL